MADHAQSDALDATLRAGDPWRWASSRFVADPKRRAALVALYALDLELHRIPRVTSEPMLAEIRFAWWRERLEGLADGRERLDQPVLQALAAARDSVGLDPGLAPLAEARAEAITEEPLTSEPALTAWLDATSGLVARAALKLLAPDAEPEAVVSAARVWGLDRLVAGVPGPRLSLDPAAMRQAEWARAKAAVAGLPPAAFPAVAHLAISTRKAPLTWREQLMLTIAVARGRL